MKYYEGYIEHLKSQIQYWQMLCEAERQKNMKLEDILKKIEERIYNLEKEGE